jgi:hypothetical protein
MTKLPDSSEKVTVPCWGPWTTSMRAFATPRYTASETDPLTASTTGAGGGGGVGVEGLEQLIDETKAISARVRRIRPSRTMEDIVDIGSGGCNYLEK